MTGKLLFVSLIASCALSAQATVWRVNQTTGDDAAAALDSTGATPFRTIQAAIDMAAAGETVRVDPGVYNTSLNTHSSCGKSRLYITKKITLEATGSRDDTVIEGAWDTEKDPEHGLGPNAVRCVLFDGGSGSTLRGFTFRNGATATDSSDSAITRGGGVYYNSKNGSTSYFYVYDCAFDHCSAQRGGGMRYGTAVRTIFRDCYADAYGAAARQADLYFCLIERCNGKFSLAYSGKVVNCTFVDNEVTDSIIHPNAEMTCYNLLVASGCSAFGNNGEKKCSLSGSITFADTFKGAKSVAENCQSNVWGGDVFSTLSRNYSPVTNGRSDGTGDVSAPHDTYCDKDLYGNPVDWTAGKLCPGAIQTTKAAASGKCVFANDGATLTVDGVTVGSGGLCTYCDVWPTQFLVKATASSGKAVARLDLYLNGSKNVETSTRPPLTLDDTAWVTAPPSGEAKWQPYETSTILYVDDDAEFEGEATGKADKPFKTIQEAIDSASSGIRVIKVMPGEYASGCGTNAYMGVTNRVEMKTGGYLRIIGMEGAEKTIIRGAADPNAAEEHHGCGPAAMRCLSGSINGVVQGFTLTDGHTNIGTNDTDTSDYTYGGAVRGSEGLFVTDSIISNNVAWRGGIGYSGIFLRCRIMDNLTLAKDGCLIKAVSANCLFTGNVAERGVIKSGTAYHVTIDSQNDGVPAYGSESSSALYLYNSVCRASVKEYNTNQTRKGTLNDGFGSSSPEYLILCGNACFRDAENGDYHIASLSPAAGWATCEAGFWWKYAGADLDGKRMAIVDGRLNAGAYQTTAPSVRINVSAGPASGVTPNGVVFPTEGGSVTITANDASTRLYDGFSVNGAIQEGSAESPTFTYTFPDGITAATIEAVYRTNWYANATSGSNANRGDSPERAKKTLAAALQHVVAGDIVHAAEGTYDDGEMIQPYAIAGGGCTPYIKCRAFVTNGVTLVADGDRDKTVILGKSDPDTVGDAEKQGCGPNAMRGVVLFDGARLSGFTVSGGRTDWENKEDDNNHGGGVLASSVSLGKSTAENCIVTNCRALRGGGARYGTFRKCRFINNSANRNGAASRDGHYLGCHFDGNDSSVSCVDFFKSIRGCTFTANNGELGENNLKSDVENTLLYLTKLTSSSNNFVNCAIPENANVHKDSTFVNCETPADAIDHGNYELWLDMGLGETDADGKARVSNRTMDIGCYELDWRPRYGQMLCGRSRMTVTAADQSAHAEENGTVSLLGGSLAGTLNCEGEFTWSFPVTIVGGGSVDLVIDGNVTKISGEGAHSEQVKLAAGEHEIAYNFTPASDGNSAELGRIRRMTGMTLFVR